MSEECLPAPRACRIVQRVANMAPAALSSTGELAIYLEFVGSLLIVVLVCAVLWWFWPFRDRTGRDRRG